MKAKLLDIKSIAIILRPGSLEGFGNLIQNLIHWLINRKKLIQIFDSETERLRPLIKASDFKKIYFVHNKNQFSETDLIITLGGDGTLIGTIHLFPQNLEIPPIFGVNLGHLGFLTEFQKHDFFEELDQIFSGKIETFQTELFSVQINSKGKLKTVESFLNDAVISKQHISRLFTLSIDCNQENITHISGDGLIISSPLGSTAYSLAAGGPIVHPNVKGLIISPICPHSLMHRPMVIPNNSLLSIRLISKSGHVILTIDGQRAYTLGEEDTVLINTKRSRKVTFVKNINRTYFHTLKEKFFHGLALK